MQLSLSAHERPSPSHTPQRSTRLPENAMPSQPKQDICFRSRGALGSRQTPQSSGSCAESVQDICCPAQREPSPPQSPHLSARLCEFTTPSQPVGWLFRGTQRPRESKTVPESSTPSQPLHVLPSPPQRPHLSKLLPDPGTPSQPGLQATRSVRAE